MRSPHARSSSPALVTSPHRWSCPTSSTREINDSALTLLEAGHLSNVEQPDAFTAAVTEFLS